MRLWGDEPPRWDPVPAVVWCAILYALVAAVTQIVF